MSLRYPAGMSEPNVLVNFRLDKDAPRPLADKLRPLNPLDFVPTDLVTATVPYSANATMRAEAAEVERRHDCRQRCRGGLVAADLQAVLIGPEMIGIVDHPGSQPEHLALELSQGFHTIVHSRSVGSRSDGKRSLGAPAVRRRAKQ